VDGQKLPSLIGLDAGKLFCSSEPSMLTEPETEYVVRCIKHVFNQHLILQVRLIEFCILVIIKILSFKNFSLK
jgi:coatomer protein complex subunit gamma